MKPASRWLRRSSGALSAMRSRSVSANSEERLRVSRWVRSRRMRFTWASEPGRAGEIQLAFSSTWLAAREAPCSERV